MKKVIHLIFTICAVLFGSLTIHAQDARFSQYFNAPLTLNPAMAGNGIEYIRVTGIYRSQWAGMGTPFTTQGFNIDKIVNRVGIGASVTRNGSGDASIKNLNVLGNLAYHLPLGTNKISTVSAGVQVGVVNKSFDESRLTFDNQYNPDAGYDPALSSGEVFSNTSITRPDVNAGLMWQRGWLSKETRFKPFAGISFSHITRPVETFIAEEHRVPVKTSLTAGAGISINDRAEVRPSAMMLHQGTFQETTFGSMLNYQLDNKNTVQLGAYHRVNDALIAYAGYQMNLLFVGMSYDVNTGPLSKTGKGTNAFEISLTYSPRPKRKKEPHAPEKETVKNPPVAMAIPVTVKEIPLYPDQEMMVHAPVENPQPVKVIANTTDKQPAAAVDKPKSPDATAIITTSATNKPALTPDNTDTDGDGIPDKDDHCPYIRGTVSMKGCPDSDHDGIADLEDECPFDAGPVANKGCPDPNVPLAKNNMELVKSFNNILFATGSVKLTTDDIFDIIERAVDVLYADKNTVVLLSGHTDSEGDAFYNMKLSQARADIVREYLLRQGIDENRIQTVAYGETMPVRNNLFEETRKENRRVELNIMRKK